jgi:hypothetical protein
MKLSGLLGAQLVPAAVVQLVPVPVQTTKFASVFGSVISMGALMSAPLIMIFDVSAFANNSEGIVSSRRMTKTEGSRFTVYPHIITPKLDHRKLSGSIRWSIGIVNRHFACAICSPGSGILRGDVTSPAARFPILRAAATATQKQLGKKCAFANVGMRWVEKYDALKPWLNAWLGA